MEGAPRVLGAFPEDFPQSGEAGDAARRRSRQGRYGDEDQ